ncbi:MAG TPA: hypothetical protein VG756_32000 [Pseudonocardiaceae bacterium]|nr:hypothetical protein [Pseudonocardiaceae bacterium]
MGEFDAEYSAAQNSIVNTLTAIFTDIRTALDRTSTADQKLSPDKRSGDRYLTGGVNWDSYDLPTLVSMVATPADPSQVVSVAEQWRAHGVSITQTADDLQRSLTTLMAYWQGDAAGQASSAVSINTGWLSAVGQTTSNLAESIEDAAGALRSAQATMPGSPASSFWSGYQTAADGASAGAATAGPVGAGTGALIGGLTSVFGANADQTALKTQAVQTMQRYEQAAVTIDSATPVFTAPGPSGANSSSGTGSTGTGTSTSDTSGLFDTAAVVGGAALLAAPALGFGLGSSSMPAFADDPQARWDALTGGGGSGGGLGGSGLGSMLKSLGGKGTSGLGGSGMSGLLEAGAEAGADRKAAANAAGEAAGLSGRGGSSVMEEVGGGEPMMSGGGASGAAGQGSRNAGDGEHKRRIPFEDEPFTTGLKAVAPVIGLTATS